MLRAAWSTDILPSSRLPLRFSILLIAGSPETDRDEDPTLAVAERLPGMNCPAPAQHQGVAHAKTDSRRHHLPGQMRDQHGLSVTPLSRRMLDQQMKHDL